MPEGEAEAWYWRQRHHVEVYVRRFAPLLSPGGRLKIYNVENFNQRGSRAETPNMAGCPGRHLKIEEVKTTF